MPKHNTKSNIKTVLLFSYMNFLLCGESDIATRSLVSENSLTAVNMTLACPVEPFCNSGLYYSSLHNKSFNCSSGSIVYDSEIATMLPLLGKTGAKVGGLFELLCRRMGAIVTQLDSENFTAFIPGCAGMELTMLNAFNRHQYPYNLLCIPQEVVRRLAATVTATLTSSKTVTTSKTTSTSKTSSATGTVTQTVTTTRTGTATSTTWTSSTSSTTYTVTYSTTTSATGTTTALTTSTSSATSSSSATFTYSTSTNTATTTFYCLWSDYFAGLCTSAGWRTTTLPFSLTSTLTGTSAGTLNRALTGTFTETDTGTETPTSSTRSSTSIFSDAPPSSPDTSTLTTTSTVTSSVTTTMPLPFTLLDGQALPALPDTSTSTRMSIPITADASTNTATTTFYCLWSDYFAGLCTSAGWRTTTLASIPASTMMQTSTSTTLVAPTVTWTYTTTGFWGTVFFSESTTILSLDTQMQTSTLAPAVTSTTFSCSWSDYFKGACTSAGLATSTTATSTTLNGIIVTAGTSDRTTTTALFSCSWGEYFNGVCTSAGIVTSTTATSTTLTTSTSTATTTFYCSWSDYFAGLCTSAGLVPTTTSTTITSTTSTPPFYCSWGEYFNGVCTSAGLVPTTTFTTTIPNTITTTWDSSCGLVTKLLSGCPTSTTTTQTWTTTTETSTTKTSTTTTTMPFVNLQNGSLYLGGKYQVVSPASYMYTRYSQSNMGAISGAVVSAFTRRPILALLMVVASLFNL